MGPSPHSATTSPSASSGSDQGANQLAGRAYQTVTIAAMVLLLASLWLFW